MSCLWCRGAVQQVACWDRGIIWSPVSHRISSPSVLGELRVVSSNPHLPALYVTSLRCSPAGGGGLRGESSTYAAFRVYWHRKCGRIPALISHEKSLDGEDAAMLDPSVHVNKRPFHPFLIHEDGLLCPADVLTRSRRRSTHFPVTPGYSSVAFVFYCTNLSFFTPQMYFSQFLWARPGHSEVVSGPHVAHGPLFLYLTSNKRTPHFRTISEGSIVLYRVTWVRTRPLWSVIGSRLSFSSITRWHHLGSEQRLHTETLVFPLCFTLYDVFMRRSHLTTETRPQKWLPL